MSRLRLLVVVACLPGCPPGDGAPRARAASTVSAASADDAGWTLTADLLDRWLALHRDPAARPDGGRRERLSALAREEEARLRALGLGHAEVERIEAVVADVMAERAIEAVSAAQDGAELERVLGGLSPVQRARAELVLGGTPDASSARDQWVRRLEGIHGPEAIRVVLTRESEVATTWEALVKSP